MQNAKQWLHASRAEIVNGHWSVLRKGTETTVLTALSFDLAVKAAAALSKLGIECTVRNGGR